MQKVEDGAERGSESHGSMMKASGQKNVMGRRRRKDSEKEEGRSAEKRGHLFPASTKRNELVAGDERMQTREESVESERKGRQEEEQGRTQEPSGRMMKLASFGAFTAKS